MPQFFLLFFFLLFGSHAPSGTATHQNTSSTSTSVGSQTAATDPIDGPSGSGGGCDPTTGNCGP